MVSTQDSLKTVIDTQDSVNDQQLPTSAEQNDQKPEVEDPFQDENYLKKLKVYAEKLKISLDDVQSRRLSKNQLKRLVRNQVFLYPKFLLNFVGVIDLTLLINHLENQ